METAIPRPKTRIPVPRTCAGQRSDAVLKTSGKSSAKILLENHCRVGESKSKSASNKSEKSIKCARKPNEKLRDKRNILCKSKKRLSPVLETSVVTHPSGSPALKKRGQKIPQAAVKSQNYQVFLPTGFTQAMQVNITHAEYSIHEEAVAQSLKVNVKCHKATQTDNSNEYLTVQKATKMYVNHLEQLQILSKKHEEEMENLLKLLP
ncbi:uncharacterized protein LOC124153419 isoform X1 [Ischnura elegans]|uniref:uncharacterized protein LOC124153419 isoform X1 n=1 Tax=Ischnura elegans TaxID=197161 RepID=UPI001ED8B0CC|nr:uncharacterized protein LOC124153419 isoform X1 [Ischnura elegans]